MKIDKGTSSLVIGMALFAMFFGSGNLIFPLFVGKIAQENWIIMGAGFLIAAVLLPFLGVIAMVLYKGSYSSFFNVIGRVPGFILSTILLTVWIPLGSAPRCMALAYASLTSYFSMMPPFWVFGLIYSGLVFVVVSKKLGILDILGKWITPLLLSCIAIVMFRGFLAESNPLTVYEVHEGLFFKGMVEGYNTMDLIASFFFSASIIHILNKSGGSMKQSLALVVRSSLIGMGILAAVYICLIAVSSRHAGILSSVPKDQALAFMAQFLLGRIWSFISVLAIILACFSTSIALILAYTDYLHDELFKQNKHPVLSIAIALIITFAMSLFGLEGITFVTAPLLQVCYPLLICLIVVNIVRSFRKTFKDAEACEV